MKRISVCILFCFWTISSYSQNYIIEDTAISYNSDQINISYSPTDIISKIAVLTNTFKDRQYGLEFSLITKQRDKNPGINIDSIILTDSRNTIVTLNRPYRDTIFYNRDGGLTFAVILRLDKSQIETLRQENITEITLIVDSTPLTLSISKKSQVRLKAMANANL